MELNEREAHCVARLLQSAWFGNGQFDGCKYCKYVCVAADNPDSLSGFNNIRKRLTEETGVDLTLTVGGFIYDSEFPYHKFLKNANEKAKNYFRHRFDNI